MLDRHSACRGQHTASNSTTPRPPSRRSAARRHKTTAPAMHRLLRHQRPVGLPHIRGSSPPCGQGKRRGPQPFGSRSRSPWGAIAVSPPMCDSACSACKPTIIADCPLILLLHHLSLRPFLCPVLHLPTPHLVIRLRDVPLHHPEPSSSAKFVFPSRLSLPACCVCVPAFLTSTNPSVFPTSPHHLGLAFWTTTLHIARMES